MSDSYVSRKVIADSHFLELVEVEEDEEEALASGNRPSWGMGI